MKSDFTPGYRRALPLTRPQFEEALEDLRSTAAYAVKHDYALTLDEVFCQILALEHRIIACDKNRGETAYIRDSLVLVERALKWAWFARDEEKSVHGLYAEKLQEAVTALVDLHTILGSSTRISAKRSITAALTGKAGNGARNVA